MQNHGEVITAPAVNLQISEIRLLELVYCRRLFLKLTNRLDHDVGRGGDQVVRLEPPINRDFRYKIAPLIRDQNRKFTRRELRAIQRLLDYLAPHLVRDAVPNADWLRLAVPRNFLTIINR